MCKRIEDVQTGDRINIREYNKVQDHMKILPYYWKCIVNGGPHEVIELHYREKSIYKVTIKEEGTGTKWNILVDAIKEIV